MPTMYMTFWSVLMIGAMGVWRLRNMRRMLVVLVVTAVVLLLSQTLFVQLSINAGVDPSTILTDPFRFLASGPMGWLALLVMPCGWLGPIIGMNLVQQIESRDR